MPTDGRSGRAVWGRWVDIVLAIKITDHLTKTQILDPFPSQVYLSNDAGGAKQSSAASFHQPWPTTPRRSSHSWRTCRRRPFCWPLSPIRRVREDDGRRCWRRW